MHFVSHGVRLRSVYPYGVQLMMTNYDVTGAKTDKISQNMTKVEAKKTKKTGKLNRGIKKSVVKKMTIR